jgi:hypothetical protein
MSRSFGQHIGVAGQHEEWDGWLKMVRERRNAVYAFNDRELGIWDGFWQAVGRYSRVRGRLEFTGSAPRIG